MNRTGETPLLCSDIARPVGLVVEAWGDAAALQVHTWSAADLKLVQCIVFASLQILREWSCDAHLAAPHHRSSREERAKRHELGLTASLNRREKPTRAEIELAFISQPTLQFLRGVMVRTMTIQTRRVELPLVAPRCLTSSVSWARVPLAAIYGPQDAEPRAREALRVRQLSLNQDQMGPVAAFPVP